MMAAQSGATRHLDESTFRKRNAHSVAHDDVIEQPNIDQTERLFHPLGDEFVGLARLGNPGRMIVSVMRPQPFCVPQRQ